MPGLAKTLTIKTTAAGARRDVQADPVHARPRALRPRRHAHLPRRQGRLRHRARPRLLQLPARRRDQPRAGEGAVGAARGDAGAPGDDRPRDAPGPGAVPRDGDAEPDRVRGHVPAARGAGRPLHAQGADRVPAARRGADRRPALSSPSRPSSSSSVLDARASCAELQRAVARRLRRPGARQRLRGRRSRRRRAIPAEARARPSWRRYIAYGASPRGPISLVQSARALAFLRGRDYVVAQDVDSLAKDALRHRLVLSYQALAEEVDRGHDPRPRARGRAGAASSTSASRVETSRA